MPLLFSYGTLQKEKVQIENFGRKLIGEKDTLSRYQLNYIEISDKEVLRKSEQKHHPILQLTGNEENKVEGVLFEISEEELLLADKHEVDDYQRIEETFTSGKKGFVYVAK